VITMTTMRRGQASFPYTTGSMEYVQGVSFPRSGHYILVDCLKRYFESYRECLLYGEEGVMLPPAKPGQFSYCEWYTTCRQFPCKDPATTFQKSHDFDLQLPILENQKYIVQWRHPVHALMSYFFLWSTSVQQEPSQELWNTFFFETLSYWKEFYDKWVRSAATSDRYLICSYEALMREPVHVLSGVVRMFRLHETPDQKRLEQIVFILDIRERHAWKTFPFALIPEMRSALEGLLAQCLPSIVRRLNSPYDGRTCSFSSIL